MKIRGILLLLFGGLALLFHAWQERTISRNASAAPEAVSIETLEQGAPKNPYLTLGSHVPVYQLVIYSQDSGGKLNYEYYPVVSATRLRAVEEKLAAKHHGDSSQITDAEWKQALDLKVLVKTTRYSSEADLKTAMDKEQFPTEGVTGMVTNDVDSLKSEEVDMLKKDFPSFDSGRTVILEQGRVPTSASSIAGQNVLGMLLIFGSFGLMRKRR